MIRLFALSITASLGVVLTLGACSSDADPGATDASSDASDASVQPETSLGGCTCRPANTMANPAGCPTAFNVQEVLNKACTTPGLVCSYTSDDARCNCGINVRCGVDPWADAGSNNDGGDAGAALVWQAGN